MTNANISQRNIVRIAGLMFLFAFIIPTLNWVFVLSKLIDAENIIATADNIMAQETLYRVGITVELIMALGLMVLALALYTILKPVNKYLAKLALYLKLVETAIVAVLTLASFIALQMLNGDTFSTGFTAEQLKAPVGFLLNAHTVLYAIPMVFLGLDMTVFSYLFFKSNYIPRLLAGFGIVSFVLILIHALMSILAPQSAAMPLNQAIFWSPSGLFEIVIGLWLLIRGVNIER